MGFALSEDRWAFSIVVVLLHFQLFIAYWFHNSQNHTKAKGSVAWAPLVLKVISSVTHLVL